MTFNSADPERHSSQSFSSVLPLPPSSPLFPTASPSLVHLLPSLSSRLNIVSVFRQRNCAHVCPCMCICILIFPFCNKFRQRSTQSVTGAGFTRTCSHSLSFSPHRSLRLIHFSPRKNVAWLTVGAIWQLGWAWNKTSGSLHFKLCNCRSEILLQHAAGESERLGRWLNWGYTVYSLKLRREESGEVFKKKSQKPWAFASALNVLNADYYQMESNPTPPDGSQLYNLFRYRVPLLTETFIAFISMQLKDQAWKKQHFRQNLRV